MGSFGAAGGLVVAGGVQGECAEDLRGGGVDDGDFQVLDAQSDVGSSDSDVVQFAVVSQGDYACFVDLVGADSVVGVVDSVCGVGGGFGAGLIGSGRGAAALEGAVGSLGVVLIAEAIQQCLELGQGRGLGWLGQQPFLHGLLEAFNFPAGSRMAWAGILLGDASGS